MLTELNSHRPKYSQKGFTLIEALVGIALLGIVMVIGIQGYDFIRKSSDTVSSMNTIDNRVAEIIQSINGNISQQVISFPDSTTDDELENKINEKLAELPMAWSLTADMPAVDCSSCPGRYGYIITNVPNYLGLYMVTIRFTHTDWHRNTENGGDDGSKKYRFMVTR